MKPSNTAAGEDHRTNLQRKLDDYDISFIIPAIKHSNKTNLNHPGPSRQHRCINSYTMTHEGWKLPATEEAHPWCGRLVNKQIIKKCFQYGVESTETVEAYQEWCFRASCKKCCKKWLGRLCNRGARRIENFAKRTKRKIFHFLLSPPRRQLLLSDRNMIKKVLRIIREANFSVAIIFHLCKIASKENSLYYRPHFHLVGFGWNDNLKKAADKHGWFSKCFGERKGPAFYTLYYLLSHCGIKKGFAAIRWTGQLSYRKSKKN